jgi:hypothetical protein
LNEYGAKKFSMELTEFLLTTWQKSIYINI